MGGRKIFTLYLDTFLEIQCDDLSVPSNGAIISCSSGSTGVGYEGDTCNFTCNTGYELIGIDNRTCQSDGTWSGNETRCSKRGKINNYTWLHAYTLDLCMHLNLAFIF